MKKEHETKVLNINTEEIEKKLIELGAKKTPEFLMRRWVFDWVEKDPDHINEWIRLREEHGKTTLTYKNRLSEKGKAARGVDEIEVHVDNFDKTAQIFLRIPFKRKFYQENKRTIYNLDKIEISIDTWPGLAPHIEIEGKTKKDMQKGLELLGLEGKEVGDLSVRDLYKEINIYLHTIPELKFENFKKI